MAYHINKAAASAFRSSCYKQTRGVKSAVRSLASHQSGKMSYILHYFDFPGRAEGTRLLFKLGGIPYTDKFVVRNEWPTTKQQMPFGQVPVLEYDGKMLAQSSTIERYVAKVANLYPSDPWEAAQADSVVDLINDVNALFGPTYSLPPEEKIKKREEILAGSLKEKLNYLSKFLEGKEYVAGNSISHADVALLVGLSYLKSGLLDGVPTDILEGYPILKAFRNGIARHPVVLETYANYTEGPRVAYKPDP